MMPSEALAEVTKRMSAEQKKLELYYSGSQHLVVDQMVALANVSEVVAVAEACLPASPAMW